MSRAAFTDEHAETVGAALEVLGIKRLTFAIHDVSFPADAVEDTGHGSPCARAAGRLLAFVRGLGFNGVQLGPQGKTTSDNPSPYDGMLFSRNVAALALCDFEGEAPFSALADPAALAAARAPAESARPSHADHRHAHVALERVIDAAFARYERTRPAAIREPLAHFAARHADWLERDALYDALRRSRGGAGFRSWTDHGRPHPDRWLWQPAANQEHDCSARRRELLRTHQRAVERYTFAQWLLHSQHGRLREQACRLSLALYGDLQVGMSDGDAWGLGALFLEGYALGAPPSRTNPQGQLWNYPVLDPRRLGRPRPGVLDAVGAFLEARFDKVFAEYDGVRIDHPHGLVCPWVYRTDLADPAQAVLSGARLFAAPDLPDHPRLAAVAIARPEQLDRSRPRWADDWVAALDEAQVARYAVVFDALVANARRHGRSSSDLVCEVLSTLPRPLALVLERHRLGRFRVLQKANLHDAGDVYRLENADARDWVMLGTHDTPPVWKLLAQWDADTRTRWAHYLGRVLRLGPCDVERLRASPNRLPQAMLAHLFACPAENVMVFFTDLFGFSEVYNLPGIVQPGNWCLRLPADFEALYAERLERGAALDLPLALCMALRARGEEFHRAHAALAARLAALVAWRG